MGTGYVKERSFNICSLHLIQVIIFWIVPVPKTQLRFLCIYFSILYERLGVLNSQRLGWHFSTEDLYKLGSEQTVHFSSGCSLVYLANWQASSNSLWYSDRWNWPSWKSFPSSGFFVGSWSWRDLEKMIGSVILCGRNNDFQAGDLSEKDFTLFPGTIWTSSICQMQAAFPGVEFLRTLFRIKKRKGNSSSHVHVLHM